MTVAALIFATGPGTAFAEADGVTRVRRIADAGWSGGAIPIVAVVAPGDVAAARAALAGAEAEVVSPGWPDSPVMIGIEAAVAAVAETSAVVIWPIEYCWVGPGTVTSLIEAHGADRAAILRPTWEGRPGWPCLVPLGAVWRLRPAGAADDSPGGDPSRQVDPSPTLGHLLEGLADGMPVRELALGDPGTVRGGSIPRDQLPPYLGQEERPGFAEAFDPSVPSDSD